MRVVWRVLINVYRLLTWPWGVFRRLFRKRGGWVELSLQGAIDDVPNAQPAGAFGLLSRLRSHSPTVSEVRELSARVAGDPYVQGVLLQVSSLRAGWTTLHAIREALRVVVDAGKRVVVYLPEGASQRELLVASAGSTVAAPGSAGFSVLGPLAQRSYIAPLLQRIGLRFEVIAQGRFKTAAEALVQSDMSEAEREQSSALIATLTNGLSAALATRVGGKSEPRELFADAVFGSEHALQRGVLDESGYRDEIEARLGLDDDTRPLSARAYLKHSKPRGFVSLRRSSRFAVLSLHGAIGDVSSTRSIGLKPTAAALKQLRRRDDVQGVILHIDSPGGSAMVSDLIHHEVQRLAAKKPVVAWMGNVAASGGYYIAVGAARIVAHPSTITGSIGVISAHLVAEELLNRVGIYSRVVKQTPHADFAVPTRALRDDERALLARESERFYERFLQVVSEGRNMSRERVAELAQGRVWSGSDAHAHGLVDVLGGFDVAVQELRRQLEGRQIRLDDESPLWVHPPRAGSWLSPSLQLPARLEPIRDLLELASSQSRALAYSLVALEAAL